MRILSVCNINQVAETYQGNLIRRGHTVDIFEPSQVGATASRPVKMAMMLERLFDLRRVLGDFRSSHYDVAHIHWASYGILGFVSQIPFLVECHGSDVRYRLRHPFHRALLKAIFRRAAGVHCITPDLLPVVKSIYPNAIFFPGPIDTERFSPPDKVDEANPWTILLFIRLDAIKGAEIAVEGVARFAKYHPEVCVQLLDWGVQREMFKQKYGQHFQFLSQVPSTEVQNMIRSADVVVGQCKVGGLGLSELQAMSCAKPVIASFGYPEAYSTPPPLCQAATPEEIQTHLETLFQNQEAAKNMGQRAREWILQNHDSHMLAVRLEALYQSILSLR